MPDIWYQVRKNISDIRGTLPQGIVGPGFNDDFGDTFGLIYAFTSDGFSHRELRDYVEAMRSELLQVADVSKIEIRRAGRTHLPRILDRTAGGPRYRPGALIAALQAQNAVAPAGSVQTSDERIIIRVTGAFRSGSDLLDINISSNGRLIRLRDIAETRRSLADPRSRCFVSAASRPSALRSPMRDGGDILLSAGMYASRSTPAWLTCRSASTRSSSPTSMSSITRSANS